MFLHTVLRATWCTVILINLQLSWKQEYWVHPRIIPGCYRSDKIDSEWMTSQTWKEPHWACRHRCGNDFKKLVGVAFYKCYCGNDFGVSPKALLSKNGWNMECGGFRTIWMMHSFVPPLPGCFGDDWSRDLEHHAYTSSDNTNEKCRKVCGNKGYAFAGTQEGDECWCGNRYGSHSKKPDEECDDPCPGNSKQVCGGGWRNWVSVSAPAPAEPVSSTAAMVSSGSEYRPSSTPSEEDSSSSNEQIAPDISCLSDQYGKDYKGTMSWAAFGQRCVKWADIYKDYEIQKIMFSAFKDVRELMKIVDKTWDDFKRMSSSDKKSNHCRNIDGDPKGPWCFTDQEQLTWDYCVIPICPNADKSREVEKITCKTTKSGQEYAGSKATTKDGLTCRGWSNTDVLKRLFKQPKMETNFDKFPPSVQMSNLCRNPDDSPDGPWCYIEGQFPKWDYCGIPFCNEYGSETIEKFVGSHAIRLTPFAIAFTVSTFSLVTIETFGRL